MKLNPEFEVKFGDEFPNEKSEDGHSEIVATHSGICVNDTWVPIHNIPWLLCVIKKFYIED